MLYIRVDLLCHQEGALFSFYLASFCPGREHNPFFWNTAPLNLGYSRVTALVYDPALRNSCDRSTVTTYCLLTTKKPPCRRISSVRLRGRSVNLNLIYPQILYTSIPSRIGGNPYRIKSNIRNWLLNRSFQSLVVRSWIGSGLVVLAY